MKRSLLALTGSTMIVALTLAQGPSPFKLGTFERDGRPFVGVVLRDTVVIDLAAASTAIGSGVKVAPPTDMKDLIARYDQGLRAHIQEVIRATDGAGTRPYVHQLSALRTLPPIMYPTTMINVALNYREHATEMAGLNSGPPALVAGAPAPGTATPDTQSAPGIWERSPADTRWNPYMFLKSPSAVIADGRLAYFRLGQGRIELVSASRDGSSADVLTQFPPSTLARC